MKAEKILIIGGHGYIGRALSVVLQDRFEILIPDKQTLQMGLATTYKYLERDFDTVIILASEISNLSLSDVSGNIFKKNVDDLNHFIAALPVTKQIIYFSSMAVYGRQDHPIVKETDLCRPVNLYGLSKLFAEELLDFHAGLGHKIVTLRIPGVFGGERKSGLLYSAREKALSNDTISISTKGLPNWETIYIKDLVTLVSSFLLKYDWSNSHEIFNLSYGEPTDVIQTIKRIIDLANSKSELSIGELEHLPISLSNEKISKVLKVDIKFQKSLEDFVRGVL